MKHLPILFLALSIAIPASAALSSKDRKTMTKLGQGDQALA